MLTWNIISLEGDVATKRQWLAYCFSQLHV